MVKLHMSHSSETSKRTGKIKKQNYCKVAFVYPNRLGKSSFELPHHKLLEDVGRRVVSLRLD